MGYTIKPPHGSPGHYRVKCMEDIQVQNFELFDVPILGCKRKAYLIRLTYFVKFRKELCTN